MPVLANAYKKNKLVLLSLATLRLFSELVMQPDITSQRYRLTDSDSVRQIIYCSDTDSNSMFFRRGCWITFYTSIVTGHHRGPKRKLHAGYRALSLKWAFYLVSESVTTVLVFVIECNRRHIFHRWVWYHALSLCYASIRHSGITYSITHPSQLIFVVIQIKISWSIEITSIILVPNCTCFQVSTSDILQLIGNNAKKIMSSPSYPISSFDTLSTSSSSRRQD